MDPRLRGDDKNVLVNKEPRLTAALFCLTSLPCPFACPFLGHGELPAALAPAALKHVAAIFGLHAGAKTMGFGALALFWLVGSFWHIFSLYHCTTSSLHHVK
jgi:hypothetical protein